MTRSSGLRAATIAAAIGVVAAQAPAWAEGALDINGHYHFPYKTFGNWQINRVTTDSAGKTLFYCVARNHMTAEKGLRFAYNWKGGAGIYFEYGFAAPGTAALGEAVPVEMWFDADRAGATKLEFRNAPDETSETAWLRVDEDPSQGPGMEDLLMNAGTVSFAYAVDGAPRIETFELKDSNATLKALFDCGQAN